MHNYLRMLLAGAGSFEKGQVYAVEVMHDHDCGIYKNRSCNCQPDIVASRADGSKFAVLADGKIMEAT